MKKLLFKIQNNTLIVKERIKLSNEYKEILNPSLTVLNLKFLLSTEKLSFFTILLLRNLSFCYILIV